MANYCIMNNEKRLPACMQVQNLVDGKQGHQTFKSLATNPLNTACMV